MWWVVLTLTGWGGAPAGGLSPEGAPPAEVRPTSGVTEEAPPLAEVQQTGDPAPRASARSIALRPPSLTERAALAGQVGFLAAAGWLIAAPAMAAVVIAAQGTLPNGVAPLLYIPLAPLLLAIPPAALAAASMMAALTLLGPLDLALTAAAGASAAAATATVLAIPAAIVLLRETPDRQLQPGPYSIWVASFAAAASALFLLPAASGALAAGASAAFLLDAEDLAPPAE